MTMAILASSMRGRVGIDNLPVKMNSGL